MTESYDRIQDGRNISEAERDWESAIDFSPDSTTYKLVRALLTEAERIDGDLEEIYESHHIESATGRDLEKFGEILGVYRNTGESDNKYRARIKGKFRASTTGATWDDFVEFVSVILSTSVENIEFSTNYGGNPATITVSAGSSVYLTLNITASEVEELLGDGVPAGHEVEVLTRGTFRLKKDGDTDDASKGLTGDGSSTGGTLAGDIT